jgi:hypothetical protein
MPGAIISTIVVVAMAAPLVPWAGHTSKLLQERRVIALSPGCRVASGIVRLRDLPEASGVAASRRTPGVLWAHNDSGGPAMVALNEQGSVIGRVRVTAAEVDDWEDIAAAPCPQGSCVYIGDIGDNSAKRDHITVYRVPEPSPQDESTQPAESFRAVYPEGPRDAEALFVTERSEVFIITKGDPGLVAIYRFSHPLRSGSTTRLERVGTASTAAKVDARDRPTAADVSLDGRWVAVRTIDRVVVYRTADLTSGRWREAFRTDVSGLREPRGEGLAFAADGSIFLVGEGGGASSPGTFARLACTLNPSSAGAATKAGGESYQLGSYGGSRLATQHR